MLGEKLKELREANGLVQRQVAAALQIDTAYVSKMEQNEKPVNRIHLKKISKLYNIPESALRPLWLAAKIYQVLKKQSYVKEALELVLNKIENDKAKS